SGNSVTFRSPAPAIVLTYTFSSDGYLTRVRGQGGRDGALLVELPRTIRSVEADTLDDFRHLAFGYRVGRRDGTSVAFSKRASAGVNPQPDRRRAGERQSVRRLTALRGAALCHDRYEGAALDEAEHPRQLRVGPGHFRHRGARGALAAQPARDADQHPDAAS